MEKEKIKKLFSDDGFINQLLSKETPEEVQLLLEEQDVFISIKEIIDFKEQIKHKLVQISDGNTEFELTEEEMKTEREKFLMQLQIMQANFERNNKDKADKET